MSSSLRWETPSVPSGSISPEGLVSRPETRSPYRLEIRYLGLMKLATGRASDTIYLRKGEVREAGIPEGAIAMEWGLTVLDLLRGLAEIHGARVTAQVLTAEDSIRNGVIVLVNGTNIASLDGPQTKLEPSTESQIVLYPVSGGG
jgi:hypothetical protein